MKSILLDVSCLNEGIPPMSASTKSVMRMIRSLDPKRKRCVLRKIKKLCKRSLSERLRNLPLELKVQIRDREEKRLGFKSDNGLFNDRILAERINLTRRFLSSKLLKG